MTFSDTGFQTFYKYDKLSVTFNSCYRRQILPPKKKGASMPDFLFQLLIPVIILVLLIILITQGYVKAPPDHAYIISGLLKEPRILIGRAGFKIPFFEQLDKLYLGQITVDIKTDEYIPTNDFINVMVDAVAKVRVADDHLQMKLAMRCV